MNGKVSGCPYSSGNTAKGDSGILRLGSDDESDPISVRRLKGRIQFTSSEKVSDVTTSDIADFCPVNTDQLDGSDIEFRNAKAAYGAAIVRTALTMAKQCSELNEIIICIQSLFAEEPFREGLIGVGDSVPFAENEYIRPFVVLQQLWMASFSELTEFRNFSLIGEHLGAEEMETFVSAQKYFLDADVIVEKVALEQIIETQLLNPSQTVLLAMLSLIIDGRFSGESLHEKAVNVSLPFLRDELAYCGVLEKNVSLISSNQRYIGYDTDRDAHYLRCSEKRFFAADIPESIVRVGCGAKELSGLPGSEFCLFDDFCRYFFGVFRDMTKPLEVDAH